MSRIIACIGPDTLCVVLRSRSAKNLVFFQNLPDPQDVFDRLWDEVGTYDLIVIDHPVFDVDDLTVALDNHPQTRFIVVTPDTLHLPDKPNLVLVPTTELLQQVLSV